MNRALSEAQRLALNTIYQPFRRSAQWPQYAYVDKALDRAGAETDTILPTLPQGLIIPDPARPNFFPQPHEELRLTIAGIAACNGADHDLNLFVRALRFFVDLERDHEPPPSGGDPLRAASAELEEALGFTKDDVRRVYFFLRDEIGVVGGGGGNPDDWSFEIPAKIRRFRGVNTIGDYLERRVVPPLYPEAVAIGEVVERVVPIVSMLEPPLGARHPTIAGLSTITAHPVVSGLILLGVGVVVAMVFGIR